MKILSTILMCALFLIGTVRAQQGTDPSRGLGFTNDIGRSSLGVSANCPTICQAIYTPTCGFSGICYRSFGNSCELTRASCSGQGNFQQVPITECSRPGVRMC